MVIDGVFEPDPARGVVFREAVVLFVTAKVVGVPFGRLARDPAVSVRALRGADRGNLWPPLATLLPNVLMGPLADPLAREVRSVRESPFQLDGLAHKGAEWLPIMLPDQA